MKRRGSVWVYHLAFGSPNNMTRRRTERHVSDAKDEVEKFFKAKGFHDAIHRYCTKEEVARYVSLLIEIDAMDRVDPERWAAGPLVYEFSFKWGNANYMTSRAEVTRVAGTTEVEVQNGLL